MPLFLDLVLGLPRLLLQTLPQRLALALILAYGDGAIAHGLRVAVEELERGQRALGAEQLLRTAARCTESADAL